ncbi:MAG TPA: hypothetical protein VK879_12510 [Candidatus Sulfomarinibacteraceae bacterium]|nr:hypothetical protein [Candidatus Sulfomarinibacteraceae bacterium]
MTTTTVESADTPSTGQVIVQGAIAGVVGGVVFGVMMAMMGMLPMVGMLVRVESAVVGFIVHLVISAFIGAVYGLVISRFANTLSVALAGGVINGIVWWVLGALLLMPLMLGMSEMVFVVEQTQWMSLLGHLLYGVITALVFLALRRN